MTQDHGVRVDQEESDRLGMTQEELADRFGQSLQSVSAIENAKNIVALASMAALVEHSERLARNRQLREG